MEHLAADETADQDSPDCEPAAAEPYDAGVAAALANEIRTLAAAISSTEHRMLVRIARFDRMRAWEHAGHRTCAHWLSVLTEMDMGTARERVRVARALKTLPETSAALAGGALSFSKVRAITRVAQPETETDLLELAEGCTAGQLEVVVRAWKKHSRLEEAELERQRLLSRRLSIFPEDGMYVVYARLPAEGGASLQRAVDEMSDEIYRAERASGTADDTAGGAARRRADALVQLAERAVWGVWQEDVAGAGGAVSGTRAERHQVMLYVEPETLRTDGEPGRSELEDGTRVSAETSRRVACDAGVVRIARDEGGAILDVGRRTRTIPPALRRALEVRDRGCRFPGCGLRFTEAHHVEHWADGGQTSLANTVLLCRHHHRLVHEEGWRIEGTPNGRVEFADPQGRVHFGGQADGRVGVRVGAGTLEAAGAG